MLNVAGQAKENLVALSYVFLKSAATLVIGGIIRGCFRTDGAPVLAKAARPVAKAGINAGLVLYEPGRWAAAELRES
jgi:hypothetical protein